MKLKATIGGTECELEINSGDEKVDIVIEGEKHAFEVSEPERGVFLFKTDQGVLEAFVESEAKAGIHRVTVADENFEIGIFDPRRLRAAGSAADINDGTVEIKSAMPGKVVQIIVEEGQQIARGDGVVVVEAMKMQNELKSPKDGIVRELRVTEDDRVNSGDVLAVIE